LRGKSTTARLRSKRETALYPEEEEKKEAASLIVKGSARRRLFYREKKRKGLWITGEKKDGNLTGGPWPGGRGKKKGKDCLRTSIVFEKAARAAF